MTQVLVGLFTLSGVVLGTVLQSWRDRTAWAREQRLQAGLLVAETYDLVWGEQSHSVLRVHLLKLRIRLSMLDVAEARIDAFDQEAQACWKYGHENFLQAEEFGDDRVRGVSAKLLDAYEESALRVTESLIKRRSLAVVRGGKSKRPAIATGDTE